VADAVLIYADSFRSPDMRHAVPLGVPDAFLYAEQNGSRHVIASSMEATRIRELGLFDVHVYEELGYDELLGSEIDYRELEAQLALRAVASLGLNRASVPENFPVWLADRLRADGVELDVDQDLFDDRRRAKTDAQLGECGERNVLPRRRWTRVASFCGGRRSAATSCCSTASSSRWRA